MTLESSKSGMRNINDTIDGAMAKAINNTISGSINESHE